MDTLYTFWDSTHYKTKSIDVGALMNSASKMPSSLTPILALKTCCSDQPLRVFGHCLVSLKDNSHRKFFSEKNHGKNTSGDNLRALRIIASIIMVRIFISTKLDIIHC